MKQKNSLKDTTFKADININRNLNSPVSVNNMETVIFIFPQNSGSEKIPSSNDFTE